MLLHTVYWELSTEEEVYKFCISGSIRGCFLALFILAGNLYMRLPESQKAKKVICETFLPQMIPDIQYVHTKLKENYSRQSICSDA